MSDCAKPSTSTVTLGNLNDDVLQAVFRQLRSANDVQRLRGVNKRFRRIIQRQGHLFARPRVETLRLVAELPQTPREKLGQLRTFLKPEGKRFKALLSKPSQPNLLTFIDLPLKSMKGAVLSTQIQTELGNILRRFVVEKQLAFDWIVVDDAVLDRFLAPFVDVSCIKLLSLTHCVLRVSETKLIQLLRRTKCEELRIEYCYGAELVLTDSLLTNMKRLRKITVIARPEQEFVHITDRTLQHWIDTTMIPSYISFLNCATGISVRGVSALLNRLVMLRNQFGHSFTFDLGKLQAHPTDVKRFLASDMLVLPKALPDQNAVHCVTQLVRNPLELWFSFIPQQSSRVEFEFYLNCTCKPELDRVVKRALDCPSLENRLGLSTSVVSC